MQWDSVSHYDMICICIKNFNFNNNYISSLSIKLNQVFYGLLRGIACNLSQNIIFVCDVEITFLKYKIMSYICQMSMLI